MALSSPGVVRLDVYDGVVDAGAPSGSHGSCQKPHGLGAPMQAQFDAAIEAARLDPVKRPHRLFLTGDQIYADDVATCLLPGLADLGKQLLGATETLKGPGANDANDATT